MLAYWLIRLFNPLAQWLECVGNIDSSLASSQGDTSGEQQMESPLTDEAHISYVDTGVLFSWVLVLEF